MRADVFAYALPPELIAQQPLAERVHARMLVAGPSGPVVHQQAQDLPAWLRPGDLLVLNATRVIPARLPGRKTTGGELEVLLVHRESSAEDSGPTGGGECWRALIRGKVRPGMSVLFAESSCQVEALHADGTRSVRFPPGMSVLALTERIGHVPLPPYIARPDQLQDRERYQTVFARAPGSVAAPTAGLHLDQALLARMRGDGVEVAEVELSIGPGTFQPVDTEHIEDFRIHQEHCRCPAETVARVLACKARGGRVVAVGTTVLRTLETAARQPGGFATYAGWTSLFLHPPQRFAVVDALMTNFHMPRSSLLMAVACLVGTPRLQELYAIALQQRYRFLSYGDCMLLLPDLPGG